MQDEVAGVFEEALLDEVWSGPGGALTGVPWIATGLSCFRHFIRVLLGLMGLAEWIRPTPQPLHD